MLVATFCGGCGCQSLGCDRFVGSRHETKSKPACAYIQFSMCVSEISIAFLDINNDDNMKHTYQSCKFCLPRVLFRLSIVPARKKNCSSIVVKTTCVRVFSKLPVRPYQKKIFF